MVYSNQRKLCLSGWLKENGSHEYYAPLKLQKFLLLYEAFTKVEGEQPDFSHLRGYKRGPVFSQVWGDYTHERRQFDEAAVNTYNQHMCEVNAERAEKSLFIVKTLSEYELSALTHKMNLWKAKEQRIMAGEYQVDLDASDFNAEDVKMLSLLNQMYPIEMVRNSAVIEMNNHFFVFPKNDIERLTEEHFDTLGYLTEVDELRNPVYVDIDEEGRLIVD